MKTRFVFLAFIVITGITSCSDDAQLPSLWRVTKQVSAFNNVEYVDPPEHPNQYWDISENGTYVVKISDEGGTIYTSTEELGSWTIYGEDLLKMTDKNDIPCLSYTIKELSGNSLVLEVAQEENGCESVYKTIYFERE